jgi:hypothetical protein
MPARETEGIRIEAPGGCLRLESPPREGTHLDATLLLCVSYWLQRGRTRLLPVTGWGGAARISPSRGRIAAAWCRSDCGRGAGRACLQGEVPSLRGASA